MENAASNIAPVASTAADNACQAKEAAREAAKKALDRTVSFAKEKPLLSLAIAAGVGLLVGALARRS